MVVGIWCPGPLSPPFRRLTTGEELARCFHGVRSEAAVDGVHCGLGCNDQKNGFDERLRARARGLLRLGNDPRIGAGRENRAGITHRRQLCSDDSMKRRVVHNVLGEHPPGSRPRATQGGQEVRGQPGLRQGPESRRGG